MLRVFSRHKRNQTLGSNRNKEDKAAGPADSLARRGLDLAEMGSSPSFLRVNSAGPLRGRRAGPPRTAALQVALVETVEGGG